MNSFRSSNIGLEKDLWTSKKPWLLGIPWRVICTNIWHSNENSPFLDSLAYWNHRFVAAKFWYITRPANSFIWALRLIATLQSNPTTWKCPVILISFAEKIISRMLHGKMHQRYQSLCFLLCNLLLQCTLLCLCHRTRLSLQWPWSSYWKWTNKKQRNPSLPKVF